MSVAAPGSLLERVQEFARQSHKRDVFVPIEDTPTFTVAAREMAIVAAGHGGKDLAIVVDSITAEEITALDVTCQAAERVFVLGDSPGRWAPAKNITNCSFYGILSANDQFLVAISSTLSMALVVSKDHDGESGEDCHVGGWTGLRTLVRYIAEMLLASSDVALPSNLPDRLEHEAADAAESSNLHVMTALTRLYANTQRDITMAKADLSSVLDILKAISGERRAHDILYVFVEKIASVVGIDRCSVVRVWGGEDVGHVLASHEDASVHDLVISLEKYPEISEAIARSGKVLINNVEENPLTHRFAQELTGAGITALLVIPIVLFDQNVGSFFLRAARKGRIFEHREVSFCEIVAEAAANALERAHLIESIQKANKRLERLAITDGLTGLFNHRFFQERLQEEFERAMRYGLPLSCMLIDVDDFKQVNDTYGHLQGDAVLREISSRALRSTRKNDIIARYGGEELVAILPQTGLEGAIVQANRLLREVSEKPYPGLPEGKSVTVSIGVTVLDRQKTPDSEAFIQQADEALYDAKANGKNQISIWGADAQ